MKLTVFALVTLSIFSTPAWTAVCSSDVSAKTPRELFNSEVVFGGLTSTLRSYSEHGRTAAHFTVKIYVDDPRALQRLRYRYVQEGNRFVATEILSVSQICELSFEPGIARIGASGR